MQSFKPEIKKSICAICESTQCGLDLHVYNGKIVQVEGSIENPYNKGIVCMKGAATCEYVYNPDRIKTPLKRVGVRGSEEFVSITWEEAYQIIAEKLQIAKKKYGPESVMFFSGYAKYYRPFLKRLAHSFGSPNYISPGCNCSMANKMAQKLVVGKVTLPDIQNARCLLIWGRNPFYSNIHMARGIMQAKKNGLKIITVDPRITPIATQSDIHLRPKPGTDGALALTMAHVIIEKKNYDQEFVAQYTQGFKEFKQYVNEFTPEKGEAITGIPAEKIIEAASMYATIKPACVLPSPSSVVHQTNGIQNQRAIFTLVGLTGNYDIVGGNIVNPSGFMGKFGGFLTREKEFVQSRPWEAMAPRVGQECFPIWSELVDEAQGMHLPAQIRSGKPYPIKTIIGFGLNNRMWPDSKNLLKSLKKLDFFVNVDLFMTETCRYADIVLPACTAVERSELRCYSQNYVMLTQPAIEPLYQSHPDVQIIFDLASRLELDDPLLSSGYEACLDWMLKPSGITVNELKKYPSGMYVPNPIRYVARKYVKNGFNTPSGKLEFISSLLASNGINALPFYQPPGYSKQTTPGLAAEYPFVLSTGARLPMFVHTRTFRLPSMAKVRPEPAADLNSKDAARLGIKEGNWIKISTPAGSIVVKANLTDKVMSGMIHMCHGYFEANVNNLIESYYLDPISGFPGYKVLLCRVERVRYRKKNKGGVEK